MQVKYQPCGPYQTNCYIYKGLIIDPGMDSYTWVVNNTTQPRAIVLTHAHFDHVWDAMKLKHYFDIPIYIHEDDDELLQIDIFNTNKPKITSDIQVKQGRYDIGSLEVDFIHYPGHTPGSMAVVVDDCFFSGDFVFDGSIGRYDFEYSSVLEMKNSLNKFLSLKYDKIIYPGHGNQTTIKKAQENIRNYWLKVL
ncbi:MAG: MBL fold metallo-hydrolase [Epsilonproteobacteria bacterium]|nr:MBL fold metallo-hydrolase [Campylobacterota bacterium]